MRKGVVEAYIRLTCLHVYFLAKALETPISYQNINNEYIQYILFNPFMQNGFF